MSVYTIKTGSGGKLCTPKVAYTKENVYLSKCLSKQSGKLPALSGTTYVFSANGVQKKQKQVQMILKQAEDAMKYELKLTGNLKPGSTITSWHRRIK